MKINFFCVSLFLISFQPYSAIAEDRFSNAKIAPEGCYDLNISMGRFIERSHGYLVFKCDHLNNAKKHYLLRLYERKRTERGSFSYVTLDELVLPWREIPDDVATIEPSCPPYNPKIETGAIGGLTIDPDEIVNIKWAWQLDISTMKLKLISPRGLKCEAVSQGGGG